MKRMIIRVYTTNGYENVSIYEKFEQCGLWFAKAKNLKHTYVLYVRAKRKWLLVRIFCDYENLQGWINYNEQRIKERLEEIKKEKL